ncbi:Crp/Fnr family transcriptional regulator (plasmid) [Novosphingobium sp. BL-8A]
MDTIAHLTARDCPVFDIFLFFEKIMPMLCDEYHSDLLAGWWFAGLTEGLRQALLGHLRVKRLTQGEHIYEVGGPPNGLHCVLDGEVRLFAYPRSSRPFITRILRQGDWFGSLSTCDMGPQPNDAVAFETVTIASLSVSDIDAIAIDHPAIWRQIALMNGREHRFSAEFVMAMMGQSMSDRLSVLLKLGSIVEDDGVRVIKITQEDLAAVAGFSRQRINALLQKLEKEGRIERGYGSIRILDESLIAP